MNESLLAAATLPFRLKKAEVAKQVVSSSQADASKLQLEAQQVLCFVALPIDAAGWTACMLLQGRCTRAIDILEPRSQIDTNTLDAAISDASAHVFKTAEVIQILDEASLVSSLRRAFAADSMEKVADLLAASQTLLASTAPVNTSRPSFADEIAAFEHAFELKRKSKTAVVNLDNAVVDGRVVGWWHDKINTSKLAEALSAAERLDWQSADLMRLLTRAKLIRNLRQAMHNENWEQVQLAVQAAELANVSDAEVQATASKLQSRTQLVCALDELRVAVDEMDEYRIMSCLANVEALRGHVSKGCFESLDGAVQITLVAADLTRRLHGIQERLEDAISLGNMEFLASVLDEANDLHYRTERIASMSELHASIKEVEADLKAALASGGPTGWDFSTIDTERLAAALSLSAQLGSNSALGVSLADQAQVCCDSGLPRLHVSCSLCRKFSRCGLHGSRRT